MKTWHLGIILVCLFAFFFSENDALAATTILWDAGNGGSHSIFDGAINSFTTVQFTVSDTDLSGNLISDKINVKVNSTSDPVGIILTLTEIADTGTFTNTNLIFTNQTGLFPITSSQIVGLIKPYLNTDPNAIETIISGPSNSEGLKIFSTTDTSGIFMNLTETGRDTGIFQNTLHFTTGPSINGSSISVTGGDIVSLQDVNNLDYTNELVTPNPDPALGALFARYGDEVDASYNGVKENVFLVAGSAPGGGGGGLIRPSLVLDAIIGGSPYIVQPPSFGGSAYHFSDGLTYTQGNTATTFDISHYNQDIQRQVMVTGEKVNMTFKTFESYKVDGVVHMGLYIIPPGHDMVTTNSIASIEWDKGKPVLVKDPDKILSNANASSNMDGTFQYTKFSFIPAKSYDKMSFLVRAWNDHMYSTDVRVHDAIATPLLVKTLPPGVVKYENFADLQDVLYHDKFYKPEILAHIHDTNAVFPDLQGKVYWLYDTNEHSVTLVISDSEDNELFEHKGLLQPYDIEKKGDYGFMTFTTVQLNRENIDQIQQASESEEEKAKATLLEMKIIRLSKW